MANEILILVLVLSGLVIFYLFFTIRYFLFFKKSIIFTGKIKILHFILMWVIPFIWIFVLKSLTASAPGSYEVKAKNDAEPFSDSDNDAWNASNL